MIDSDNAPTGHALSLRTLRTFIVVAEELHFGRAAERLHMTQPPLSQQIRQLEALLGVELFSRTTRSVQLTPAGIELLASSKKLLRESSTLINAVRRAARGETGSLAVSFTSSVGYQLLPKTIIAFKQRFPGIDLRFNEMHSSTSIEALRSRSIDVALLRPTADLKYCTDLDVSIVRRDRLMLALPIRHELAERETLLLQDLEGLPFVTFSHLEGRYFYDLIKDLLFKKGVRPHIVGESLLPTLVSLVEAGMGAALVPASVTGMNSAGVTYREVIDIADVNVELLGVRRSDFDHPAASAFLHTMLETSCTTVPTGSMSSV